MRSISGDFWTWFSKFNAEDITGFIAVVLVFSVAAVAVICFMIYAVHKNRAEVALKRELLDRGLSADEIATIIRATPLKSLPKGWTKG
jgi:ABC-type lipoprotein release transport system permease subunit